MPHRQVVILGAGFGGLYAALHLEMALRRERSARIVLLDKENYHLFVPMLHEITSGGVEPRHVVRPLRPLFRKTHVDFRRSEVQAYDIPSDATLGDKTSPARTKRLPRGSSSLGPLRARAPALNQSSP